MVEIIELSANDFRYQYLRSDCVIGSAPPTPEIQFLSFWGKELGGIGNLDRNLIAEFNRLRIVGNRGNRR